VSDAVEHTVRSRPLGDERGHPSQRRLFVGELRELLVYHRFAGRTGRAEMIVRSGSYAAGKKTSPAIAAGSALEPERTIVFELFTRSS